MKQLDALPTDLHRWVVEPKWDGFHAAIHPDGKVISRRGRNLTRFFPELSEQHHDRFTIRGEIMANDWQSLTRRVHPSRSRTEKLRRTDPVQFVAYDLDIAGDFFARRRVLEVIKTPFKITPQTRDRATALRWLTTAPHLDGVVVKNETEVFKIKRQEVIDDTITGADKVRRVVYLTRGVTPTLSPREFHTYADAIGQDVEVLYDGQLHHGAYRGPVKILRKRLEK